MLEKVKVTGVTFFKDTIDGKSIDSGAVFIEEHLNFQTGRSKGTATQKYPLGDASKAKEKLGWTPRITFAELVKEMVQTDFIVAEQEKKNGSHQKIARLDL